MSATEFQAIAAAAQQVEVLPAPAVSTVFAPVAFLSGAAVVGL